MTDVSGIPNMGWGGGGYFGGNAATGQPAMSANQINQSMWGGYSPGQAQSTINNLYTGGGFGGMTDYYSSLGAAYGRQTGGFGGGAAAPTPGYNDSAGLPQSPASYGQGTPQYDPWTGAFSGFGPSMGSMFDPATYAPASPAANPYAQMYRMPQANPEYFNPATYAGSQGNYGIPYNGRPMGGDIGFSRQGQMPNIGYNPSMQNMFANPGMSGGDFQSRYGLGFGGQGTPSQYAPGAQMPPGYAPPFSVDNPGGALPGYRNPFGENSQAGG